MTGLGTRRGRPSGSSIASPAQTTARKTTHQNPIPPYPTASTTYPPRAMGGPDGTMDPQLLNGHVPDNTTLDNTTLDNTLDNNTVDNHTLDNNTVNSTTVDPPPAEPEGSSNLLWDHSLSAFDIAEPPQNTGYAQQPQSEAGYPFTINTQEAPRDQNTSNTWLGFNPSNEFQHEIMEQATDLYVNCSLSDEEFRGLMSQTIVKKILAAFGVVIRQSPAGNDT